jgi:hypothetical protein
MEYSDRCFRVSYASIAPNELHSLARPARGKGKEREDQIFQKERSTNTRIREYHRKSAHLPFIRTEYPGSGHLNFFEASLGWEKEKLFIHRLPRYSPSILLISTLQFCVSEIF